MAATAPIEPTHRRRQTRDTNARDQRPPRRRSCCGSQAPRRHQSASSDDAGVPARSPRRRLQHPGQADVFAAGSTRRWRLLFHIKATSVLPLDTSAPRRRFIVGLAQGRQPRPAGQRRARLRRPRRAPSGQVHRVASQPARMSRPAAPAPRANLHDSDRGDPGSARHSPPLSLARGRVLGRRCRGNSFRDEAVAAGAQERLEPTHRAPNTDAREGTGTARRLKESADESRQRLRRGFRARRAPAPPRAQARDCTSPTTRRTRSRHHRPARGQP